MSGKRQRDLLRLIHLVASGLMMFYIYAPLDVSGDLRPVLQFLVVPLLALTGQGMWHQGRLRKLLNARARGGQPVR